MVHQILLFYKYVTITDPEVVAERLRALMVSYNLLGRAIVAEEGLNVTVEGQTEDTEKFVIEFLADERFSDIYVKKSEGTGKAFPRIRVKVRDEIVGTHFDKNIDPRKKTAPRIAPEELKQWFEEKKDFVIVDMRNDYEYKAGRFKGSVNPELQCARELPQAMPKLESLKDKTVLTVCTGGVRCEKMSAYLLSQGFKDVYQLENGIHGYMQKYPGQDFEGALYTFDNRLAMNFGGERDIVGVCHLCAGKTENYVNCKNDYCHLHFLACQDCTKGEKVFCSEDCPVLTVPMKQESLVQF